MPYIQNDELGDNSKFKINGNDDVVLLELYKAHHDRLKHEYDLSWHQIRLLSYVSGAFVASLGVFKKYFSNDEFLGHFILGFSLLGLSVSFCGVLIFLGSLDTAKGLRKNLASIEVRLGLSQDVMRYHNFENTYSSFLGKKFDIISFGKLSLMLTFVIFWIFIILAY